MSGGYIFIRGIKNQKRHETHESCSLIRPLASKIFTRTAVYFPTDMQTPSRHSATTSRGNSSRRGALRQFVAMEVRLFVLYFLFLFEQFRHHPELPFRMRSVHALPILMDRISTGIFRMERSALCGKLSPLYPQRPYLTWTVPSTLRERRRGRGEEEDRDVDEEVRFGEIKGGGQKEKIGDSGDGKSGNEEDDEECKDGRGDVDLDSFLGKIAEG